MGLDSDVWEDEATGEVWVTWSSNNNLARARDGLATQGIGMARLNRTDLAVLCREENLYFPVRSRSIFMGVFERPRAALLRRIARKQRNLLVEISHLASPHVPSLRPLFEHTHRTFN